MLRWQMGKLQFCETTSAVMNHKFPEAQSTARVFLIPLVFFM